MKFTWGNRIPADGTVLILGIRYGASISGRVYTYAALLAGGRWYFTGRGPQDAAWAAVERWMESDGREVLWVKAVTETVDLWPEPAASLTSPPFIVNHLDGTRTVYPGREQMPVPVFDETTSPLTVDCPVPRCTATSQDLPTHMADYHGGLDYGPGVCEIPACGCSGPAHA